VARYNPLKIEQSVPELYPRLVQYVNGKFYDGNGNLINITGGVIVNNPLLNKLIISDGTTFGLTTVPDLTFENGVLIINGGLQLTDGSQQDGYFLVSDSSGLATWTSSVPGLTGPTGSTGATGPTGPANIYTTTEINSASFSTGFEYVYYGVIYTSGICTVYLPAAISPNDDGKFITITDEVGGISSFSRGINVMGSGTQSINGYSGILMKVNNMSLTFMFRNNNWKTI
jgi:hypothetical protein